MSNTLCFNHMHHLKTVQPFDFNEQKKIKLRFFFHPKINSFFSRNSMLFFFFILLQVEHLIHPKVFEQLHRDPQSHQRYNTLIWHCNEPPTVAHRQFKKVDQPHHHKHHRQHQHHKLQHLFYTRIHPKN